MHNLHTCTCTCSSIYSHVFPTPQDITVAGVENDISQTLLQISYVTSRLKRIQQTLDEQQEALQKQNELISHTDVEITRNNALIERKQTQIDQMNKKINQKLSKMEGVSGTVTVDISMAQIKPWCTCTWGVGWFVTHSTSKNILPRVIHSY